MDAELSLRIENVIGGLRNYGYLVTARPTPNSEREYYEEMRDCLGKVDATVEYLRQTAHCRGYSKRTLHLLHKWLPEPCWGVHAP